MQIREMGSKPTNVVISFGSNCDEYWARAGVDPITGYKGKIAILMLGVLGLLSYFYLIYFVIYLYLSCLVFNAWRRFKRRRLLQ